MEDLFAGWGRGGGGGGGLVTHYPVISYCIFLCPKYVAQYCIPDFPFPISPIP